MKIYSQYIFPRLLDWTMASSTMSKYRKQLLQEVTGEVLEIGFGTGLNLAYYPETITHLTTVDVNAGMNQLAKKRIKEASFPVSCNVLNGDTLPFADQCFDSVVSTWTLCSITNIDQALKQVYRVLKPEGKFFFIEHGLSDNPQVQVWQNRLTPLQKMIGDGCHLNRNMEALISRYFPQIQLEKFKLETEPEIIGYLYQGVATK
ncbi:class I SAM-dependent methyltransferase [Dactylococcopsis salina]|uniref:Methylase involved in ubiquinone/menaquinone biosynthesis n=1 Tax=Dactylococcopsis salina (strain PCC 8305) TaxID=13035 RepID=K9YT54_DACS8|nr:class I SAM-dependent methyltransferase [Dactylococcopsis salina]AFZ49540.1 methylase involved in ubiquinone/menaquinone biosynthesis [Dactylococcopsis salina PCC 8305]